MSVRSLSISISCIVLVCVSLTACAQFLPVPGGSDAVNMSLYGSDQHMKDRLGGLEPSMTREKVFQRLDVQEENLTRLTREEIIAALFGGREVSISGNFAEREHFRKLLQTLEGYRLDYKDVKKNHGFSSPIRIRTEEEGVQYSTLLLFQYGKLIEKPVLTGGAVSHTSSKTLFDWLTPGTVMNAASN